MKKKLFDCFGYSKSKTFYSYDGYFYQLRDDGNWKRVEMYLPCGTGTLKEPLEDTMYRFLERLDTGEVKAKMALNPNGSTNSRPFVMMEDGSMKRIDRVHK